MFEQVPVLTHFLVYCKRSLSLSLRASFRYWLIRTQVNWLISNSIYDKVQWAPLHLNECAPPHNEYCIRNTYVQSLVYFVWILLNEIILQVLYFDTVPYTVHTCNEFILCKIFVHYTSSTRMYSIVSLHTKYMSGTEHQLVNFVGRGRERGRRNT